MSIGDEIEKVINRTYVYVLPMVAFAYNLRLDDFKGFKGCFVRHANYPDLNEHIFLHFKVGPGNKFKSGVEELLRCVPEFVFCDTSIAGYNLICLKIPAEFKREYDKFIQSKYSEFSENYKKCIIKFHNLTKSNGGKDVLNILYRTEEGYLAKEEMINQGLEPTHWTRIPRDQEIGMLLSEIIDKETFHYKTPNENTDEQEPESANNV